MCHRQSIRFQLNKSLNQTLGLTPLLYSTKISAKKQSQEMVPIFLVISVKVLDPNRHWRLSIFTVWIWNLSLDSIFCFQPKFILTSYFTVQQNKQGQPYPPGCLFWGGAAVAALPVHSSSQYTPALCIRANSATLYMGDPHCPVRPVLGSQWSWWGNPFCTDGLHSHLVCPPAPINCGL